MSVKLLEDAEVDLLLIETVEVQLPSVLDRLVDGVRTDDVIKSLLETTPLDSSGPRDTKSLDSVVN